MNNLLQQALEYHQAKNWREAERVYKYLLKLDPKNFDALMLLGLMHAEKCNPKEAIEFLTKAIKINDKSEIALYNIATAYTKIEKFLEAERYYKRTLVANPGNLKAISELAALEMRKGNFDSAINLSKTVLKEDPDNVKILRILGEAQRRIQLFEAAIESFDLSLQFDPACADTYNALGNIFYECGDLLKSETSFNKAIEINPSQWAAQISLGNILRDRGLYFEAMLAYDKALSIEPNSIFAIASKAQLWAVSNQHREAIEGFNKAYAIDPYFKNILGGIIYARLNLCDWQGLNDQIKDLQLMIDEGRKATEPFVELAVNDSPSMQLKTAQIYYQNMFSRIKARSLEVKSASKITVAYLSADFRLHPISYLMAELFEIHNRDHFEIVGISFSSSEDRMQQRLSKAFDQFIQADGMTDKEVLDIADALGVDIAIDLGGYTQNSRFSLFAKRVAPIQMSYLGYLGSTGSDCIDFIIADKVIIPEESRKFYSEKIAYLPSYQVNDSKRMSSERIFTRSEFGIPEDAFVFCSFNNNYKILPEVFSSWMRILKQVPKSVLFVQVNNPTAKDHLMQEATDKGIDSGRLIFGSLLSPEDYLARYALADLFLDTYPYNAGTTASDSLWAGVPVLTCQGESFASRVASSILTSIGMPELIAKTIEEYESIACRIALSPGEIMHLKSKLSMNREITPLFNTKEFAINLESLYKNAFDQAKNGKKFQTIEIGMIS